jgi:hypothetical protein
VLVPILSVTKLDTVAFANTDTDFSIVSFPSQKSADQQQVYDRIMELGNTWALIRGKVIAYKNKDGVTKPEIKLLKWSQVLAVKPLTAAAS